MKTNNSFYIHKLKEDLSNKQKINPLYSQRSYAKFLGIHSATLNLILNGKRSLPVKNIKGIADKLTLNPKEKTLFVESLYKSKLKLDDIQLDKDDNRFGICQDRCRLSFYAAFIFSTFFLALPGFNSTTSTTDQFLVLLDHLRGFFNFASV